MYRGSANVQCFQTPLCVGICPGLYSTERHSLARYPACKAAVHRTLQFRLLLSPPRIGSSVGERSVEGRRDDGSKPSRCTNSGRPIQAMGADC